MRNEAICQPTSVQPAAFQRLLQPSMIDAAIADIYLPVAVPTKRLVPYELALAAFAVFMLGWLFLANPFSRESRPTANIGVHAAPVVKM